MTTEREALAGLVALYDQNHRVGFVDPTLSSQAWAAARAVLAQPEPEPVIATVTTSHDYGGTIDWRLNPLPTGTELYAAPPAPAQPLSDEQIDDLSREMVKGGKSVNWLARAIERALKGQP